MGDVYLGVVGRRSARRCTTLFCELETTTFGTKGVNVLGGVLPDCLYASGVAMILNAGMVSLC